MLCNKQLQNLEAFKKSLFLHSHESAGGLGFSCSRLGGSASACKSVGLSSRLWWTPHVFHPPWTSDNTGIVLLMMNSWCTSQTTHAHFKFLLTNIHHPKQVMWLSPASTG